MAATDPQFVISRVFKAPRARVWEAWAKPELMAQWFGPKGVVTTVRTLDLRPGGMMHARMDRPDGGQMWVKFAYREVVAPSRLVWEHSFADEEANLAPSPFGGPWPLKILSTVTFEEEAAGTRVRLVWTPLDAAEDERQAFAGMTDSMTEGWSGTFDRLDQALA
ncbi:SRPBCC domain-containing protein [Inquilinus limosus]|uniref:SRPBCC family protein n=1 Tax=Inquilinus limosus TaxID=171674 RepID=UPI003F178F67